MSTRNKNQYRTINQSSNKGARLDDNARKNIEKLINVKNIHGTEAYYSNRYGWTLRKIIS